MTSPSDNEREESFSDSDPYISRHRRKHVTNADDVADSGVDDVISGDRPSRISQRQNIGQRSRTSTSRFKEGTSGSLSSGTGRVYGVTCTIKFCRVAQVWCMDMDIPVLLAAQVCCME